MSEDTFSTSSTAIALREVGDDANGRGDQNNGSPSTSFSASDSLTSGVKNSSAGMTVNDIIETIGLGPYQYMLIAIAGMALIGDATEMMLLSFLGPIIQCFFGVDNPEEEAVLTTVVFIGMSIGGVVFGALADLVGRRIGLFATAFFCSVSGVISALSESFGFLIFTRFCVGIGLGGVAVAYTYTMEFIPAKFRGKAGVLLQSFWTIGTLLQAVLTWVSFNTLGWRWVIALSAIPIFILLFMFCVLPESPRYLAQKGKDQECKDILYKMADKNGTTSKLPRKDDLSLSTNTTTPGLERSVIENFKEAFSSEFRRDTILLLIIWFANAFVYYGLVLLTTELALVRERESASSQPHISGNSTGHHGLDCTHLFSDSFFGEIFVATISEMPGLVLSLLIVDRIGRKRSQSLFFLVVTLPMIILALVPRSSGGDSFLLFLARGSSMGAFTIVYIYTPERYPTRFRNTAMGMCFSFARVGGMVAPLVGTDLPERGMVGEAFAIVISVSILACISTFLLTTETVGKDVDNSSHNSLPPSEPTSPLHGL